jgi:hypothetical protein
MARLDNTSPFIHGVAVTPNDNADLAAPCLALFIGGAGALVVTMADGVDVTFGAVPAGTLLPIRVRRVKSTGTVASSIVALR